MRENYKLTAKITNANNMNFKSESINSYLFIHLFIYFANYKIKL